MRPRRGTVVHWHEVRERLARVQAATEPALRLSPAQGKAVMDARARRLARLPAPAPRAAEVLEVVSVVLDAERYGIETRHVREIIRPGEIAPLPGTPDVVLGLTNLRGELLAVFDLRTFFGLAARERTGLSRIVVLGGERAEMGVLTDAVHEVTTLRTDEVLESPASITGVGRASLRGVTEDALILLDGRQLLEDPRLFIDQSEESRG